MGAPAKPVLALAQLLAIAPSANPAHAASFLPHLNTVMQWPGMTGLANRQMFLATLMHESGDLRSLEENLNYSAEGLCRTWPSRFRTLADAQPYHRQPIKIANKVYALRGGNGDEKSGDGWRYRGAGLIQLTFKANQAACATFFKKRPEDMALWLRSSEGAVLSAAWFWTSRGCTDHADADDFDGVCDIVNLGKKTMRSGDALGFIDRLSKLRKIKLIVKE